MTRREMKMRARAALDNFYGAKMLLLIFTIISGIFGGGRALIRVVTGNNAGMLTNDVDLRWIFFGFFIALIFTLISIVIAIAIGAFLEILVVGGQWKYLEILRGGPEKDAKPAFSSIAKAYQNGTWPKVYAFIIVKSLIMFGLALVPIVGWGFAIYLGLGWSQSYYVLNDQLDKGEFTGIMGVFSASSALMKGYRWNYFVFHLSFFWWYLLTGVSLGFVGFWTVPYITMTSAAYYDARVQGQF